MIWLMISAFALHAHASLGGRASEIEKDLPNLAHRTLATQVGLSSCYSVKSINADGVGVNQYINSRTGVVFMVRTVSRAPMLIQPLMNANDFAEYHDKRVATHSVHNLTRNHKNVLTETSRLKVFIEDRQMVHRSTLILKSSVPECVTTPETLL